MSPQAHSSDASPRCLTSSARSVLFLRNVGCIAFFALAMSQASVAGSGQRTKAVAEKKVDGPLVVEEGALRRLTALMRQRMDQQVKDAVLHFSVAHADNTEYETDSLDDVLHDPNPSYNPITTLRVSAFGPFPVDIPIEGLSTEERRKALARAFHKFLAGSEPKIEVTFSFDKAEFTVKGGSVDWVFVTRYDIANQFTSITRSNYFLPKLRGVIAFVSGMGLFLLSMRLARDRYDRHRLVVETDASPTPLLRYINSIRDPYWQSHIRKACLLLLVGAFVGIGFLSGWWYSQVVDYLFPRTIFALGDQLKVFQDRVSLRSAIFSWGIAITFGVSLIAGIIANLLTSRQRALGDLRRNERSRDSMPPTAVDRMKSRSLQETETDEMVPKI